MRVVISVYVVHVLSDCIYSLVYAAFVLSYCVCCFYLYSSCFIPILCKFGVFLSCIPLFVLCAMLEQPLAEWFIIQNSNPNFVVK